MIPLFVTLSLLAAAEPVTLTWTIDQTSREALVYVPVKNDTPAPVVFAFHGHGGTARHAARTFDFQTAWPEAIVVYLQGLPTPGRLTDPQGRRNGWQHAADDQNGRDLKFFDAVLATLREKYRVDDQRIYSTGHSNGGAFTYVLWSERPTVFAALAPSAAAWRRAASVTPKPVMHVAGENDPLVRFAWQNATINTLRRVNGCQSESEKWAENCLLYPSSGGTPVVTYIHSGNHTFPAEAPQLIVRFFKEHALQPTARSKG